MVPPPLNANEPVGGGVPTAAIADGDIGDHLRGEGTPPTLRYRRVLAVFRAASSRLISQ